MEEVSISNQKLPDPMNVPKSSRPQDISPSSPSLVPVKHPSSPSSPRKILIIVIIAITIIAIIAVVIYFVKFRKTAPDQQTIQQTIDLQRNTMMEGFTKNVQEKFNNYENQINYLNNEITQLKSLFDVNTYDQKEVSVPRGDKKDTEKEVLKQYVNTKRDTVQSITTERDTELEKLRQARLNSSLSNARNSYAQDPTEEISDDSAIISRSSRINPEAQAAIDSLIES